MGIRKTYNSDFGYLGNRDYVQGSDIIYGMLDAMDSWKLGSVKQFTVSVRRVLRSQGRYLLFDKEEDANSYKSKLFTTFSIRTGKDVFKVGLEGDSRVITKRFPYDEEAMIASCIVRKDEMSASISKFSQDRLINTIIALNKRLHVDIFSASGFSPWILAQLKLRWQEMIESKDMTVYSIVVKNVIGNRMTKAAIELNGYNVGEICFDRRSLF